MLGEYRVLDEKQKRKTKSSKNRDMDEKDAFGDFTVANEVTKTEYEVQKDVLENSTNALSHKEENVLRMLRFRMEIVKLILSESKDVNVNRLFENERFVDQDKSESGNERDDIKSMGGENDRSAGNNWDF